MAGFGGIPLPELGGAPPIELGGIDICPCETELGGTDPGKFMPGCCGCCPGALGGPGCGNPLGDGPVTGGCEGARLGDTLPL